METDQLGRLRDILEAARLIAAYVANTTATAFHGEPSSLGGYRFGDFLRFGAPMQILLGVVTVLVIYTSHVR